MGKRKSAAKPPPKKSQEKLATVFSCPFCNHDNSVECRMDRKNQIGEASCRICQEKFSTPIDGNAGTIAVCVNKKWARVGFMVKKYHCAHGQPLNENVSLIVGSVWVCMFAFVFSLE